MNVKLYDAASGQLKEVLPALTDGTGQTRMIEMYLCGPTVYDYAHIGNLRPVIVMGLLQKMTAMQAEHGSFLHSNVTDIDDKIIDRAKKENVTWQEVADRFTIQYLKDVEPYDDGFDSPITVSSKMAAIRMQIQKLIDNGHAYEVNGHVYFDTNSYDDYLFIKDKTELIKGHRVETSDHKRDQSDFILWKPSDGDGAGWASKWGYGRPGWHIECSTIINEIAALHFFDELSVHAGGVDLRFPHHQNESAQYCCANTKRSLARIWMHIDHVTVNGKKMSKSLGNTILIKDINGELPPEIVRLAMFMTKYRKKLDWTDKRVEEATTKYYKWVGAALKAGDNYNFEDIDEVFDNLNNDLNTYGAISVIDKWYKAGEYGKVAKSINFLLR